MSFAITKSARARARAAFRAALAAGVPASRMAQQELFPDEDEQYIQHEVSRKLYEPKLPNAGPQERKWLELLRGFAGDEALVINVKVACWKYASALAALLPAQEYIRKKSADGKTAWLTLPGCYYTRKSAITPKTNKGLFDALMDMNEEAKRKKDRNKKWLVKFLLEGLPEAVSNFKMECLYLLRGADGNVTRLVRLVNTKGEMSEGREIGGSDILPNDMYAGSEKFRQWVQSKGNYTWGGAAGAGNTELQSLQWDVTEEAAYRVVKLIEYCGWHEIKAAAPAKEKLEKVEPGHTLLRGLWFYDECAIPSEGGAFILPDEDGIFWHDGIGYAFARKGRETEFTHGRPKMRVTQKLENIQFDLTTWEEASREIYQTNRMGGFFREVGRRFFDTAGGYEGWLTVGAALGYAAAPEIFKLRNLFPSLWVSGQMGSGKTTYTAWTMALQGFNVAVGLGLISKNVTAVGVMCQLENYSNLFVWLDEYRQTEITDDKAAILRDTYNRQLAAKWSPDGFQRTIRTAALVSGESTTSDAATRSRYPHVLISEQKRKANHYDWMQSHQEFFYVFWRHIMEHRAEFVATVLKQLEYWMQHEDLEAVPSRDRITHAVAYAAFSAAAMMFESHGPDELAAYRKFLVSHAEASAADVQTDVNVNVFLQELVVAFDADEIDPQYFRVEREAVTDELGLAWERVRLYLEPHNTIKALQIFLRKAGQTVTLRYKDLRDQLSRNSFWIKEETAGGLKRRFGRVGSKTTRTAWGIEVDLHPLGRQPVTMEQMEAARDPRQVYADNVGVMAFADSDPRKGPLFTIIEGVAKYEAGGDEK